MHGIFIKAALTEWVRLKNSKRDMLIMIGGPILYLVLFGFLYSQNVVNHIPTVVWDQDNTSLSRTVTESFRDTDRFNVIGGVDSQEELKQSLDSGQAGAAVVIPPDFMKDVKKQRAAQILVCIDGSNMIIANAVVSSSLEIIQTVSAGVGVKIMEGWGHLPVSAKKAVLPISFRPRIWYNPTFSYSDFLLLGLLGTTIQQIVLLFTAVAVVRDRESITGLNSLQEAGVYLLGKSVPYLAVNFLNLNLVLILLITLFGISFRGSIALLLVLEAVFLISLVSLGLLISTLSRNELEATQLSMIIAVPSFLISGFTWPLQAMPAPLRFFSRLLPLTHFVNAFRDLALKDAGPGIVGTGIISLSVLTLVLFPASVWFLYRKVCSGSVRQTCQSGETGSV